MSFAMIIIKQSYSFIKNIHSFDILFKRLIIQKYLQEKKM